MTASGPARSSELTVRRMVPPDREAIIRLLSRTLGWKEDLRHEELFDWKHRLNPFGESPGWVAEDEQGLAGFRTLMRWEFLAGDCTLRAVRAVDTATDPRAQGRGIFRTLTLRAVDDMTADGIAFVFNTPNAQSRPGYLSMGWRQVGRLAVGFRPSRIAALPRLLSARSPGDLWSLPCSVGEAAMDILNDEASVSELLNSAGSSRPAGVGQIRTNRTHRFLQWRYGLCPVGYRVLLGGRRVTDGLVFFRVRRRGGAKEVVIADCIGPDSGTRGRLCRAVLEESGADYAVAIDASRPRLWPTVPRTGPILTWRSTNWTGDVPGLSHWELVTGDVELF